ncbi:hypothetical protein Skr01_60350 [Sphaerisporangium krabiense]|uniref:Actinobacteria/chloroflexi VLRF1 release factor domain-containing protein n=1 Tax=Sphaerisporangium krabiense TaxID=763782 RepID=A0A7W8ZBQ9_9ACTN|nr:acVLRF1 family peptidyl-tRNA hydrolase [Sphaerisporangium krabiense]MBB5631067.1 hypothetical protein [Sphaerisporangium krabiense]GII65950.1 hypothetical protein Skr01_60350 [Sphaerisporangium krabiense]
MASRPAAGGGRWVPVAPERMAGWARGFAERHGPAEAVVAGAERDVVVLHAADGAVAECHVPFPPLTFSPGSPDSPEQDPLEALVAHAVRPRRVGVLLVRLGGHAAGVFEGERLVVSKVGARQVHGRSAAGGWSQQRFARRREKQAGEAARAAAEVALRVLGPHVPGMEAVVLGGDRRAVEAVRGDARLAGVFALAGGPFLDVPDPRLAVLREAPGMFRAVRVRVLDPGEG